MEENSSTPAQEVRECVLAQRNASLSTILTAESEAKGDGYPFGSITPYDVDEKGRVIISIAQISQHFRNLKKNPRASILVSDLYSGSDPQAGARATLLGTFKLVPEAEYSSVRESYFARFPDAPAKTLNDFVFFRCEVGRIRWIGGFGAARWVQASAYGDIPHDTVCYHSWDVLEHLNLDHRDALSELVEHFHQQQIPAAHCLATKVNRHGLTIRIPSERGREYALIPFPSSAETTDSVRSLLIELLKICRTVRM